MLEPQYYTAEKKNKYIFYYTKSDNLFITHALFNKKSNVTLFWRPKNLLHSHRLIKKSKWNSSGDPNTHFISTNIKNINFDNNTHMVGFPDFCLGSHNMSHDCLCNVYRVM